MFSRLCDVTMDSRLRGNDGEKLGLLDHLCAHSRFAHALSRCTYSTLPHGFERAWRLYLHVSAFNAGGHSSPMPTSPYPVIPAQAGIHTESIKPHPHPLGSRKPSRQ